MFAPRWGFTNSLSLNSFSAALSSWHCFICFSMRARRYKDLSILISLLNTECCSPYQGRNTRPHTAEGPPTEEEGRQEQREQEEQEEGDQDGVDSLAGDRQGRLAGLQGDQDMKTQPFSESQIRAFISLENEKQVIQYNNSKLCGSFVLLCYHAPQCFRPCGTLISSGPWQTPAQLSQCRSMIG